MPTSNAKKKSNTRTASKTAAARKKASVNAKRKSASHGTRKRKSARKKKSSWWAWPVTIVMLLVLVGVAAIVLRERAAYQEFLTVREMVDRDTFYDRQLRSTFFLYIKKWTQNPAKQQNCQHFAYI